MAAPVFKKKVKMFGLGKKDKEQTTSLDVSAETTANTASSTTEQAASTEKLKLKVLKPLSGMFFRSEPVGFVGEFPKPLADDMVEFKYAELAK